jgi:hypothetical protein
VIGEHGGAEQLLHGEPNRGNVLTAKNGLLFIDLETRCRGPVEFDLAHAPEEVSEHYPGVNQDLLRECRILVLAMIATWRWDRSQRAGYPRLIAGQADRGTWPRSERAARSSFRELMPSLPNTLRKCHSTVRGLMNSWVLISGLLRPVLARQAI